MSDRRRSPGIFTILAVLLLVGPLGFAAWYFYRQKPEEKPIVRGEDLDVVCTGRVDAPTTIISLEPSQAGRVVEVCVKEGVYVSDGAVILKLDDSLARNRLKQAEAAVKAATVDRDKAALDAERFPDQIPIHEAMVSAAGEQVTAAEKNLEAGKANSAIRKLGDAEIAAFEASIRNLKELKKVQEFQLTVLKKMLERKQPQLLVEAAEARLLAAQAEQELAQKAVDECVITAPGPGRVLRLHASKGGVIVPGGFTPAVVFAPAGQLVVRAEVEQEFLGRIQVGQTVVMEDDSRLDSPKWNGRVKSIASWVAQKRSLILDPGEINDVRTVECVIEVESDAGLVIGQRMRARIKMK
jgi:multidrug resistance efflux pump